VGCWCASRVPRAPPGRARTAVCRSWSTAQDPSSSSSSIWRIAPTLPVLQDPLVEGWAGGADRDEQLFRPGDDGHHGPAADLDAAGDLEPVVQHLLDRVGVEAGGGLDERLDLVERGRQLGSQPWGVEARPVKLQEGRLVEGRTGSLS